ncbi:MAG: methyltransferase domain-containing protein [bacterium]
MKKDKSTWEQFHDLEAPGYDNLCYTKNTVQEVDFLIDVLDLSPGDSVLDVGCGTGRHSVELARRGYSVTGIDLSSGMLAQAKDKARAAGVQVEWIHADAARFSLGNRFDAAICLCEGSFGLLGSEDDAIEHPLAILRNIGRCLKPNAKTLFTVLNGFRMIRNHTEDDVRKAIFDPLTLSSVSEVPPVEGVPALRVRERAFVPTELVLLFQLAGMNVLDIWGGTAGNWKRQRTIDLDEMEIMVVARKPAEQSAAANG